MTIQEEIRLLVLGSEGVGKSALVVRFLTRRFISFYQSGQDAVYTQPIPRGCPNPGNSSEDNDPKPLLHVMDCSGCQSQTDPWRQLEQRARWADCAVVVYSISDASSFRSACDVIRCLRMDHSRMPIMLLGNKTDLRHMEAVSTEDVIQCVRTHNVLFAETSAARSCAEVTQAFLSLVHQALKPHGARGGRRKLSSVRRRKSSLAALSRAFKSLVTPGSGGKRSATASPSHRSGRRSSKDSMRSLTF